MDKNPQTENYTSINPKYLVSSFDGEVIRAEITILSTSNLLYNQLKHRQAASTSQRLTPSTGNQFVIEAGHRHAVIHLARVRKTSFTQSPNTGNQLRIPPAHR